MHEVKIGSEVESGFMTLGHKMDAEYNKGINIGMLNILICQVNDGEITLESAARRLNITTEEFSQKLEIANEQGMEALETFIHGEHFENGVSGIVGSK